MVEETAPAPRAELVVVVLLLVAAALAVAFVVVYAGNADTQLLGLALGLSLAVLSAAFVLTAFRLTPSEEAEELYPEPSHPTEAAEIEQILGPENAAFFAQFYDVTPGGNFEGHNILNRLKVLDEAYGSSPENAKPDFMLQKARSMADEARLAALRGSVRHVHPSSRISLGW